ncbi:hypothetical protein GCM10010116_61190 [Microbispora rosea subsp. aerata]|nr:hypothetical protein [Microbispora rosea]GGO30559.1 hypothetical protein GCM10010116_61190 [Microbispora rosea subsp. aerata]GIH54371.1 hypothetical protein Mro02_12850 [Microbispora rosea subsp. aerata]
MNGRPAARAGAAAGQAGPPSPGRTALSSARRAGLSSAGRAAARERGDVVRVNEEVR